MAKERIQVSLAPAVLEMLDKLASSQGLSRSALVSFLVSREWRDDGHTYAELTNSVDD